MYIRISTGEKYIDDKLWLLCIVACEHYDVFTITAVGSDIYLII